MWREGESNPDELEELETLRHPHPAAHLRSGDAVASVSEGVQILEELILALHSLFVLEQHGLKQDGVHLPEPICQANAGRVVVRCGRDLAHER